MFDPVTLSFFLTLRRTLFIYRTSIPTKYSGLSVFRYDIKIYGPKHLTQKIFGAFSLAISRYDVQN